MSKKVMIILMTLLTFYLFSKMQIDVEITRALASILGGAYIVNAQKVHENQVSE